MRADGRKEVPNSKDKVKLIGYNMYMIPEQAARGLSLFYWNIYGKKDLLDINMKYADLSKLGIYNRK